MSDAHTPEPSAPSKPERIREHDPRLWRDDGWQARVIKNEDDDGWAVEMTRDGDPEPALVGPWTMGRDKKNPKPLDANAFTTLVKTASEVLRRHEQQRRALLHKEVTVTDAAGARILVALEIIPDEDDPRAILTATGDGGTELARVQVPPNHRLTPTSAAAWVRDEFRQP